MKEVRLGAEVCKLQGWDEIAYGYLEIQEQRDSQIPTSFWTLGKLQPEAWAWACWTMTRQRDLTADIQLLSPRQFTLGSIVSSSCLHGLHQVQLSSEVVSLPTAPKLSWPCEGLAVSAEAVGKPECLTHENTSSVL